MKLGNQATVGRHFTRRLFIGGAIVTVSALHLPGCRVAETGLVKISIDGQFFTAHELTLLTDIVELMIPRTDTPGGSDADVVPVLDGMMLSWAVARTQQQFRNALTTFEAAAIATYQKPYNTLKPEQRFALLTDIDTTAFSKNPPAAAANYKRLKSLVFRIYYSSEIASADYVPIPGNYYGNLSATAYNNLIDEYAYGR